jgi:hypothetical protein
MASGLKKLDGIIFKVLIAGISLFFVIYEILRAAKVSLTFDEAATYVRYISSDLFSVFNFIVATNHLMNTLLARFFSFIAGESELVLRLPNLIGYGFYLFFSFLILKKMTNRTVALGGFLLLNLNPYVLDYFSLCRGYGLSLGFLMGAVFFFLSFLERSGNRTSDDSRHLSYSLLMASGAVVSNFALLNFYIALALLSFAALVVFNIRGDRFSAPLRNADQPTRKMNKFWPWFVTFAALFNLFVLSQDLELSRKLYEPVSVRVVGLNEAEKNDVHVYRIDTGNKETRLARWDDVWQPDQPMHFCRLKFELPLASLDKIEMIEITMGGRVFQYSGLRICAMTEHQFGTHLIFDSGYSVSLKRSMFPAFRRVINWGGDSRFIVCLLAKTFLVLSVLAAFVVFVWLFGRLIVRLKILRVEQWRPLASITVMLASLVICPLYILSRNAELYYGGHQDMIRNTFYSLIQSSFYGKIYQADQTRVCFRLILLTFLIFIIVLYLNHRWKRLSRTIPGLILLSLIFFTSISVLGQRLIFKTPYLLGRTALFYIPLFLLFLVFLFQSLGELSRLARIISVSVLVLAVSLSVYHFSRTANLKYTLDWWRDADTKSVIADLKKIRQTELPPNLKLSLGIDWAFYPCTVYYLKRQNVSSVDVNIVPSPGPNDFFYVLEESLKDTQIVIKKYPISGSILAKPRNGG